MLTHGLVGSDKVGETHFYFSILKQNQYLKNTVKHVIENVFQGVFEFLDITLIKDK